MVGGYKEGQCILAALFPSCSPPPSQRAHRIVNHLYQKRPLRDRPLQEGSHFAGLKNSRLAFTQARGAFGPGMPYAL